MATQHLPASPRMSVSSADAPWIVRGITNGAVGAAVVALFFLIQDLLRGQALWTPHALGSALFLGRGAAPADPVQLPLVVGYTVAHGAVFLTAGLCAAFALADAPVRQLRRGALAFMMTGTLFMGFALAFLAFAATFGPQVTAELGAGNVALANLCAAAAMASVLVYFQHPGEAGEGQAGPS